MTDRDPNELYKALRSRLADYGQEPPEHLWAGIRQQLPPPVALPQRRRRRSAYVLLGLLLLVAGVASVIGWSRRSQPGSTLGSAAEFATTGPSPSAQPRPANPSPTAAASGQAPTEATPGVSRTQAAATADAAQPAAGSLGELAAASPTQEYQDQVLTTAALPGAAKARPGQLAAHLGRSAATPAASRTRVSKAPLLAAAASRPQPASRPAAGTDGQQPRAVAALAPSTLPSALAGATPGQGAAAATQPAPTATLATSSPAEAASRATLAAATTTPGRPAAGREAGTPGRALAASRPDLALQNHGAAPAAEARLTTATRAEQQQLRAVVLNTLPWPALVVQPVADTARRLLPSPVRRWSLQVLAGPALTYRQLPATTSDQPTTLINNTFRDFGTTNNLAKLERPALGFGAQVQLRRVLNGRWAVSSGLGYQEYATSLALQQVIKGPASLASVPPQLDSTISIHQRDAYRFVTVPLRLGYTWVKTNRWQLSLLAGADAALYVGGNSTEGSTCACQTQTWSASNSPYRRFSLGASLGGDLRYRLSRQWELLAQPTASYLLTSLPRPETNYSPRHLLGVSALFGVSYDLP